MDALRIDPNLCTDCGLCVADCPDRLRSPDGNHVDHTDPHCERCLHCYAVCPTGAVTLPEACIPLAGDLTTIRSVTPETLETYLAYRRSTRHFLDKPVPKTLLEQVVQTGRYVPSGGNRHAYKFTVLTDKELKAQLLAKIHHFYDNIRKLMQQQWLVTLASAFLGKSERAFLRDPDYAGRMRVLLDRFAAGEDPVFYSAPAVVILHSDVLIPTPFEDCILAGYNMALMAQSLGLGTCFVSLGQKALNASKRCKAILGLSPKSQVYAVLLVGYPEVAFLRASAKPPHPVTWL